MLRRTLIRSTVATLALTVAFAPAAFAQSSDAAAVHRRALVLDGHTDILLPETPARYYLPGGQSRTSLDRLTQGGVDAIVLSLAVGPGPRDAAGVRAARAEIDAKLAKVRALIAANPTKVGLALSPADVERLTGEGKVAVILGFQNARALGDDLTQIDGLYRDGVRVFAFNHAGHNSWSDSSRPGEAPIAEHGGLSPIGRQAVARLNDLGVLIDVSQLSTDAFLQTLRLSRAPVAATHSNARALVDNTRNLSDAELDALKANGGVVQVSPFNAYLLRLDAPTRERVRALRQEYGLSTDFRSGNDDYSHLQGEKQQAFLDALAAIQGRVSVREYVDHIDYIGKRIGFDHVGIGTDFDHGAGVNGFDSEADAPNVTAEFLRRGYSEAQIDAIWSGNFLRVWRAAQAAKRHLDGR